MFDDEKVEVVIRTRCRCERVWYTSAVGRTIIVPYKSEGGEWRDRYFERDPELDGGTPVFLEMDRTSEEKEAGHEAYMLKLRARQEAAQEERRAEEEARREENPTDREKLDDMLYALSDLVDKHA